MNTYGYSEELFVKLDLIKQYLERTLTYRTSYDELYEQVGLIVLSFYHRVSHNRLNLLGLEVKLRYDKLSYREQKIQMRELLRMYLTHIRSKGKGPKKNANVVLFPVRKHKV